MIRAKYPEVSVSGLKRHKEEAFYIHPSYNYALWKALSSGLVSKLSVSGEISVALFLKILSEVSPIYP